MARKGLALAQVTISPGAPTPYTTPHPEEGRGHRPFGVLLLDKEQATENLPQDHTCSKRNMGKEGEGAVC